MRAVKYAAIGLPFLILVLFFLSGLESETFVFPENPPAPSGNPPVFNGAPL
jgi:hypothetical protein